jgi:hypothetical protein
MATVTLSLSKNTELSQLLLFLTHFEHILKYQMKERILSYGQRLSAFHNKLIKFILVPKRSPYTV